MAQRRRRRPDEPAVERAVLTNSRRCGRRESKRSTEWRVTSAHSDVLQVARTSAKGFAQHDLADHAGQACADRRVQRFAERQRDIARANA